MKMTNEYYNKFLEFKERVKNKDFKRTEEFISNHHKNILLKMGVYEFDVKNGYSFKDIGVIEFNELLAAKEKDETEEDKDINKIDKDKLDEICKYCEYNDVCGKEQWRITK